jgi:hypothetical protein
MQTECLLGYFFSERSHLEDRRPKHSHGIVLLYDSHYPDINDDDHVNGVRIRL